MRYTATFTGVLAVAGVSAWSVSTPFHIEGNEVVEHLHTVPEGWREVGAPAPEHELHFRIAVRSVSSCDSKDFRPSRLGIMNRDADHDRPIATCLKGRSWRFQLLATLAMVST